MKYKITLEISSLPKESVHRIQVIKAASFSLEQDRIFIVEERDSGGFKTYFAHYDSLSFLNIEVLLS